MRIGFVGQAAIERQNEGAPAAPLSKKRKVCTVRAKIFADAM
jgi:hypothetical protein